MMLFKYYRIFRLALMAEKNALVAEKKQTENKLRNTEADLGAVKNQKNIAEQR